ncbi:MAG TPA: hypothetical protein VKY22_23110 [Bradyrhizobium sp.]|nr:hypothetical protein [Bradyrhizobium sp.]
MRPLTALGAAALLASALALPAMAQEVIRDPGRCSQFYPNANCQNYGPGNPYRNSSYRRHHAYRATPGVQQDAWNNGYDPNRDRSGFWPGDVAAGAVGTAGAIAAGAVNTAGAIATAPFRGPDSYAYYNNGYNGGWNGQSYAERNGFVCTPGTWFKGADGRQHPCQ